MTEMNSIAAIAFSLIILSLPSFADHKPVQVELNSLFPVYAKQDWGSLHLNQSVQGNTLKIGGKVFKYGIGTHANSRIVYYLNGQYERFESWVGVDDEMQSFGKSSIAFQVYVDGKKAYDSGLMRNTTPAKFLSLSVKGAQELTLVVTDGGDYINGDHGDWADATLTGFPSQLTSAAGKYLVKSHNLTVSLSQDGRIVLLRIGKQAVACSALSEAGIPGSIPSGKCHPERFPNGGIVFTQHFINYSKHHKFLITRKFIPADDGIRWDVEFQANGPYWSAPIITGLNWRKPQSIQFWTAWQDPVTDQGILNQPWNDPLIPQPLRNRIYTFGESPEGSYVQGNIITLPLATFMMNGHDLGLSMTESPQDTLLDMSLMTSESGDVKYIHSNHRLGGGDVVKFHYNLIVHARDWRGGLAWMVKQYPVYFNPPNPKADAIAGCAAYSGRENPIDVDLYKRTAFRVNWKLSDDFPYMGEFLPPLNNPTDHWNRANDEPRPPGKPLWTSFERLNDYAKWMKDHGFYVLDYFNTTEYGRNMKDEPVNPALASDPNLWMNAVQYLKIKMPNAYMKPIIGTCYNAWVVDPGDPAYRAHLLRQARRDIKMLPDSAGICIDRTDWLRLYNPNADDGVSWIGKPCRAFVNSWKTLMAQLGPLMHMHGKVIFSNLQDCRLDLARHLDGVYSEFGGYPTNANGVSLLCIRKPALLWTADDNQLNDAFFQYHLFMGAYPTAPYPSNNHCITPSPERLKWYVEYGPLMDAMRGKKWVLTPHCVEVKKGSAKVNLFSTPSGYVIPVVFGGGAKEALVSLLRLPGLPKNVHAEAITPGDGAWRPCSITYKGDRVDISVPLEHGCAVVRVNRG
jgi:hypothetical protein